VEYVSQAHIGDHPFFKYAAGSSDALGVWVAQEAIITGPFAQLLASLAARIQNVHVRAMVMKVANGEHGPLRHNVAYQSHPWLLDQLRQSVGLSPHDIHILPETRAFLEVMFANCDASEMRAIGTLGMGSELLLIEEYGAVRRAFQTAWPSAQFQRFLDANINEDQEHSKLMIGAAQMMATLGDEPAEFLRGTRESVDARITYYSHLLETVTSGAHS